MATAGQSLAVPVLARRNTISAVAVPETGRPDDDPGSEADRQREALLAQRESYRARVEQFQVAAAELADEPLTVEAADEEDLGDADSSGVERDRLLSLATAARRSIDAVDAALRRLDAGTYGRCERCGQAIPAARLEAVPEATHCVACKTGGLRLRG